MPGRDNDERERRAQERDADAREEVFVRVIYALAALVVVITGFGIVGNLLDRNIHVEVAALGLVLGALTTLLVGKVVLK